MSSARFIGPAIISCTAWTRLHRRVDAEGRGGVLTSPVAMRSPLGPIFVRLRGWFTRADSRVPEAGRRCAQPGTDSDTIKDMAVTSRSRSDSAVYGERLTRIAPPVSRIPSALVSSHA